MSGHVPEFIFKNAVILVDGKREVVKSYNFTGHSHYVDILMLTLAGGKSIAYDSERVKQPQGVLPEPMKDFNTSGARVIHDDGAAWEVSHWWFSQSARQKEPDLYLRLVDGKSGFEEIVYNPQTVKFLNEAEGQPAAQARRQGVKPLRPLQYIRKPE